MKSLNEILKNIKYLQVVGPTSMQINEIQFDSRKLAKNDLFVAVSGTQNDGHQFIDAAIKLGARCIVCEQMPHVLNKETCYIQVKNSAHTLGLLASAFYNFPSKKLKLVGITGTNGKTSTVTMLFNLFRSLGYSVGLLSTVVNKINEKEIASTHTTPDPLQLNALLAQMVEAGCEYCFIEVSSHAIVQERIAGLQFTGAVFSNITHDHLDFHKTFEAYIKAKKKFFDDLNKNAFALYNIDDKNGSVMVQNSKAKKCSYALRNLADYKVRIIENRFDGLLLEICGMEVWIPLVGSFNAYNILAVYATAMELGADSIETLTILSKIKTAEGRFETMVSKDDKVAIVDYAHTPDALKNVLETIQEIRQYGQQIITVVGAGGNRDPLKRPEMGRIAAALSDKVILTSDNPRNEEPEGIIKQMEAGVNSVDQHKVISITNRREAIKTACLLAGKGSILLIAGKGHEKYQEIKGVKHHFDDKEQLTEFLNLEN